MESSNILTGITFANMVKGGAMNLGRNREIVNDLNVFPVPDGDTGDNMYMTIDSGVSELGDEAGALGDVSSEIARRMLLGARGNSGVILSRIFAGIARGLTGCDDADIGTLGAALKCGIEEAYGCVSVPVEGTILTVCRESIEYANSLIGETSTVEEYFENLITEAERSLERTMDLLDVLAEAGVVDSGGAGFLFIARGMRDSIGKDVLSKTSESAKGSAAGLDLDAFDEDSVLEYGYCTEFLLRLQRSKVDIDTFDMTVITDFLAGVGDSVVAFRDGSIVKVHVHTVNPGDVLNEFRKYGEFLTIKIENMSLQHNETDRERPESPASPSEDETVVLHKEVRKPYGFVAVAAGKGIKEGFISMGADEIVDGGQSMNPCTADFIEAFERINADTILVFPNNKNVVLTANQAAKMYERSEIRVVPCKTIGEGYAAFSMLDTSSGDTEAILAELEDIISGVETGVVCPAIRDTDMDGYSIKKGDYIGVCKDEICSDSPSRREAVLGLADRLNAGKYDILMLICGEDADSDEAASVCDELTAKYKRTEVIMLNGDQPVYDYIIVLE